MNSFKNIMASFVLILIIFCLGCSKEECTVSGNHEYELVDYIGIFAESFDESVTDENRFNENNQIYKVCTKLEYSFYHEDTLGNKYYFEIDDDYEDLPVHERNAAWNYVSENEISNKTITSIKQEVKSGLKPFIDDLPDYSQTVFSYKYKSNRDDHEIGESTGLIENEKNVWMHPPRQMMFRILQTNPFPYIQEPYEIGTSWEWDYLSPGGQNWSDDRWFVWEGPLDMICEYEITDFKKINTEFGELDCYETTGYANFQEDKRTKLVSYFNEKFGFVKLVYSNINNTKTVIELTDYN